MIREEDIGLYSSFERAVKDVEKHVKDGWRIDEASFLGFNYEVMYVRYVDKVEEGKPTRAEILAKARAAKAEKAKQGEVSNEGKS